MHSQKGRRKMTKFLDRVVITAKNKIGMFLNKKKEGINGIVIEVGLLVVGVVLLLLFKEQIGDFIKNLIKSSTDKLNGMFT